MTDKEKAAQGQKIIRMFTELKDMDLEGIPLITFEEFEKLKTKKETRVLFSGGCIGFMLTILVLLILKTFFKIQL